MEHFLADRHADPFLKLESHQRDRTVEHVSRVVELARPEARHDSHEYLRVGEARHGPGRPRQQLFEQKHAAKSAKDSHGRITRGFEDARRLEGRRWILELDRACAWNLLGNPCEKRRLHRKP